MIGVIAISIPLLIYLIGAFSVARKDLTHPDDYFVAFKKVGVTAFSSSSIAYAFQVSTIYPFLLWGASNFFLVPAINTICWGIGIFLFYLCFNRYKKFIGQGVTLHGFLGNKYGFSVRIVASWLTIIGFLGIAIAETYFGSKVLLSIIENKTLFYFVVLFSMLFVFSYITYGGQVSSIRTDQLQLIMAYIGIFGLILYFLFNILRNKITTSGALNIGFLILIFYIPLILYKRKFKFIKISEEDSKGNKIINQILNYLISALLILVFVLVAYTLIKSDFSFSGSNLINIKGFGIMGLLSLMILPLCWQFVDLTNWQRLLAVKPDIKGDNKSLHNNIRKGLLIYAIESPFTWIIFLFFGLLATTSLPNFSFQDLLIDIPKQLINSGNPIQEIFGYTFIVSILAIMLSTVDSFIIAIIFTFVYDSFRWTRNLIDSGNQSEIKIHYNKITNNGRIFGLFAILVGMLFFVTFDKKIPNGGEIFINLLLAFYSAQLSFFPLIFGILFFKSHPSTFWANASMIIGAVSGITIGIYSVIWNNDFVWYPVVVCTLSSILFYTVGLIISKLKLYEEVT
jgi:hypothetical protein